MKHAKTSRVFSLLAVVLAVTMLLALVGCGGSETTDDTKKTTTTTTTTTTVADNTDDTTTTTAGDVENPDDTTTGTEGDVAPTLNISVTTGGKTTTTKKEVRKAAVSKIRSGIADGFKPESDVRGLTGDEAWWKIDKYIDDAYMAGVASVRIIHGKGTGALRAALWQFFRADKRVASYRQGAYGEGDAGVTVLELK